MPPRVASSLTTPILEHEAQAPDKRRRHIGLVAKTTIAMLAVGLIPLIVFGGIILSQQSAHLRAEGARSMQLAAEGVSAQVDEWIDKNRRILQMTASLPVMQGTDREEQARLLYAIKATYPWMYLVHTVNVQGKNVSRSDALPLADYSDRKYVTDVISGIKEFSWECVIGKTSGKPSIGMSVPIKANGQVIGVLAGMMTLEDISRIVANWKAGETGYAFLVEENAKVVAHPKAEFVLKQQRLVDHPLIAAYRQTGLNEVRTYVDANTEVLGYVYGNKMRWGVAVQQSTQELFAPLRATTMVGLELLVGAAVLLSGAAILFSRMLVKPIVSMTKAADQMSRGRLDVPIEGAGSDEIGLLAKSLDRLRISMAAAMARLGA